jgi:hypothetical protein
VYIVTSGVVQCEYDPALAAGTSTSATPASHAARTGAAAAAVERQSAPTAAPTAAPSAAPTAAPSAAPSADAPSVRVVATLGSGDHFGATAVL